jgi:hypothetical protein
VKGNSATQSPLARWTDDDACRSRPPDLVVFRYKAMNLGGAFFAIVINVVLFSVLFTLQRQDVAGHIVVPPIAAAIEALGWLVLVTTAVRIRNGGLLIDNMVIRHVIPWERFAGLSVEAGQGMFARLDDGRIVKSAGFGRSLADAIGNYGHMRRTLGRIQEACRQARSAHTEVIPAPVYRSQFNFPWVPALAFLVFFEAVSWVSFAAHGGWR